jgi:hypothetical protein
VGSITQPESAIKPKQIGVSSPPNTIRGPRFILDTIASMIAVSFRGTARDRPEGANGPAQAAKIPRASSA